jgi:RNA polymerase sigma-70 factor (ECF subfamily)
MEAEDVFVMAFTKIFERIGQYKSVGSFEGWVRRIMINECLTYLRKNKAMYLETDITAAAQAPDYDMLEERLEAEDVLKVVATLPPGYRIVFNMFALDGYSHKEIAEQLGISENTSKSQLSRARAFLQRALVENEKTVEKVEGYESFGSIC